MSTKIYTGFRFRSHDIFDVQRLVAEWRIELASIHRNELATLLAGMCAETIDRNAVNPERNAGKNPFREARQEVRTRQKEVLGSGLRDPEVDFDFELAILPHDGRIYGMVFSERSRWVDRWMELDGVEDFSYWDNTDQPDEVSEEDWDARGEVWDSILRANPAGTPGMSGFSAQCTDRMLQPDLGEVMEHIPSFEARVAARARECAMDSVYAAMKEKERLEEDANLFSVLRKIERWLDGEGAHVLESERSRVTQLLSGSITAEMLTSTLPAV
jgi:hypothetical protein